MAGQLRPMNFARMKTFIQGAAAKRTRTAAVLVPIIERGVLGEVKIAQKDDIR